VARGVTGVAINVAQGGGHDQHIARLLDRHLHRQVVRTAPVRLAVRQRVQPHVVRGEIVRPERRFGVLEHGLHQRLQQLRVEQQEHRARGICHVHGGHARAARALLGEEERLPAGAFDKLVRGDGLTIRKRDDIGVIIAAGAARIVQKLAVERFTALANGRVLLDPLGNDAESVRAAPPPVRPQLPMEVLDRVQVVVGQRDEPRNGPAPHPAHRQGTCHGRPFGGARRRERRHAFQRTRCREAAHRVLDGRDNEADAGLIAERKVQITPVNADLIAVPFEDGLSGGTDFRAHKRPGFPCAVGLPGDFLLRTVNGPHTRNRAQDRYIVRRAVRRARLDLDVADRPRQQVEVVEQKRGEECHAKYDTGGFEGVQGARRSNSAAGLLHCGHIGRRRSRKAPGLAVNARHKREPVLRARPMTGLGVCQAVGRRPHAEVWVNGGDGHGRWPDRLARRGGAGRLRGQPHGGGRDSQQA